MKKIIKDNIEVRRYAKGLTIKIFQELGFSSTIAFTEEEFKILKEILISLDQGSKEIWEKYFVRYLDI